MKKFSMKDFNGGWIIGDFSRSVHRTKDFEVGHKAFKKGEYHAPHYHAIATEYNIVTKGKVKVNGKKIKKSEMFIMSPGDVLHIDFLKDTEITVVKIPSLPFDKFMIKEDDYIGAEHE